MEEDKKEGIGERYLRKSKDSFKRQYRDSLVDFQMENLKLHIREKDTSASYECVSSVLCEVLSISNSGALRYVNSEILECLNECSKCSEDLNPIIQKLLFIFENIREKFDGYERCYVLLEILLERLKSYEDDYFNNINE